jgi:gamma-glutamyl hercynylcysteine S-oxide hydrolase
MCRLLAYMGPEISLYDLILKPKHSLEKQAWQPQELRETKLNADGFGFSWYKPANKPALYRQAFPIWNDANLKDLSQSLKQTLFFAMVRSATGGQAMSLNNTQPFTYKHWMFQHNGYIQNFSEEYRVPSRHLLNNKYENIIQGNTDSETLFALLMQHIEQSNSPADAIRQTFHDIGELIKRERSLLNIMLTDGHTIYASKHAINGLCPSLYYGKNINDFPDNSQLLVSEALNEDKHWQAIDDHSIIIIKPDQDIEFIKI